MVSLLFNPAERVRKLKKYLTGCLVLILILIVYACAAGEEAKEIREGITFESNGKNEEFELMRDGDFGTYFPTDNSHPLRGFDVIARRLYRQVLSMME